MVFSSLLFIFYFLPLLLLIYYIVPKKTRKYVLLLASLIFYFIGEPINVIYLILSCFLNYFLSKAIYKTGKKRYLVIALIYNVVQLFFFKYTNFFIENANGIFKLELDLLKIALPIGISFYTFQALSYVIDVYNKKHKPASSLVDFATYLCLFPQLIAGPIVRYVDIENDLKKCQSTVSEFAEGIKRFIIGLSKKVLIANVMGEVIELLITETVLSAWLKPLCYTLQIYFDFSGYSDMAIGLGLMLGFHFKENFNYPLIAKNVTDFWRRWHISLSSWFRDYIYIPLGGNRTTKIKWIRNIFIVWALTGFWHGASWNFVLWGLFFAVILLLEKIWLSKFLNKNIVISHIYTFIIILISFLIFSVEGLDNIILALKNMFFLNNIPLCDKTTWFYFKDYLFIIIFGLIFATPLIKILIEKIRKTKMVKIYNAFELVCLIGLFILSVSFIIDASFNPFLYFRF